MLLAILAGGTAGGIPGAILVLPLVAALPVVEKHWLGNRPHPDTVGDHTAPRENGEAVSQPSLVKAVLEGRPVDTAR